MLIEVVEVGRLALGGPGALDGRDEEEPALIEEDQMGPPVVGVFLYGASGGASSARSPRRPAGGPGAPVSAHSSPNPAAPATHGWGGTGCGSASRSGARCAGASRDRSGIRAQGAPAAAGPPASLSARGTTGAAAQGSGWAEAR